MNSDADNSWDHVFKQLRRLKGLRHLSPSEAEAELRNTPKEPISDEEIENIIKSVTSGELASWEPLPQPDLVGDLDLESIKDDVYQLNRNAGESDPETDELEEGLRRELLSDDEAEKDSP